MGLSCDVSKEENVQKAFETISKTCGTVGYLVNAAGINRSEKPQGCVAENVLLNKYIRQMPWPKEMMIIKIADLYMINKRLYIYIYILHVGLF